VNQTAGIAVAGPDLPPLQPVKLGGSADGAKEASSRGDSRVFSPFLQDGEEPPDSDGDGRESGLQRLCVRSASLENLKVANEITLAGKRKLQPVGDGRLAANRCRT
jgi:hypothetical protein